MTELGNDHSEITLYADDTILYAADTNAEKACETNQASVNIVQEWCSLNRLSINATKTKHMLVKSNVFDYDENVLKIKILGAYLENVEEYNYLGLLIDNALKFEFYLVQHEMCLRDSARTEARRNQQQGTHARNCRTCSVSAGKFFRLWDRFFPTSCQICVEN